MRVGVDEWEYSIYRRRTRTRGRGYQNGPATEKRDSLDERFPRDRAHCDNMAYARP